MLYATLGVPCSPVELCARRAQGFGPICKRSLAITHVDGNCCDTCAICGSATSKQAYPSHSLCPLGHGSDMEAAVLPHSLLRCQYTQSAGCQAVVYTLLPVWHGRSRCQEGMAAPLLLLLMLLASVCVCVHAVPIYCHLHALPHRTALLTSRRSSMPLKKRCAPAVPEEIPPVLIFFGCLGVCLHPCLHA